MQHQLRYCKRCKNRKMDRSKGLICSLTNQKADFSKTCPNFKLDEAEHNIIKTKEKQILIEHHDKQIYASTSIIFILSAIFTFFGVYLFFDKMFVIWFPVLLIITGFGYFIFGIISFKNPNKSFIYSLILSILVFCFQWIFIGTIHNLIEYFEIMIIFFLIYGIIASKEKKDIVSNIDKKKPTANQIIE